MNSYQNKWVKGYMSTAKIFGESRQSVMSEDNWQSVYNDNPQNQWKWTIFAATADASTTSAIIAYVTITYYAVLNVRAPLDSS